MDNLSELRRPIEFTIDGRSYETTDHKQLAADLLRLAGLDPDPFDLEELKGQRPEPVRYTADAIAVLGLVAGWSPPVGTVVATSGLGGLTTFSTFSSEVVNGWRSNRGKAVSYLTVTLVGVVGSPGSASGWVS